MEPPRLHEALLEAIDAFTGFCKENNLKYAFMGGLALQAWARQRATRDVDIALSLGNLSEEELIQKLQHKGFFLETRRSQGDTAWIRFRYNPSKFPLHIEIDVFPAHGDYQKEVLNRSVLLEVLGRPWRVVCPEDLILQKLIANRILDQADVGNILQEQKDKLDWTYLERWAERLGVSAQLNRFRSAQDS